jgi:hypothetical protein
MDYAKINKIINSAFKNIFIYDIKKSSIFVLIYKERHKTHKEIIDLQKYFVNKNISDEDATLQLKIILDDFNKGLRPHEYPRTYIRAYRKETIVQLKKLKDETKI